MDFGFPEDKILGTFRTNCPAWKVKIKGVKGKVSRALRLADGHSEYHKWKDPRTIEFGKRVPPPARSSNQPGNKDIHWAAVAVWGKAAKH